jgi:hypothetical protein
LILQWQLNAMPSRFSKTALGLCCSILFGCATGSSQRDAAVLQKNFQEICSTPLAWKEVRGSLWMKIDSTKESAQFPAQFRAVAPGTVQMEVTNLVGGAMASLSIEGGTYRLRYNDATLAPQVGRGSWEGIPLQWAADLFLGKMPCPVLSGPDRALKVELSESRDESHDLIARAVYQQGAKNSVEIFRYRTKQWGGKPWVEKLDWGLERRPVQVSFEFEDPSEKGPPNKWTAQSPQGLVKLRFSNRVFE